MTKQILLILSLISLFYETMQSRYSQTSNDFQNIQVNRTIDLTNHMVKIENRILIKNMNIDPINTYRFPVLKNQTRSLLHLDAKMMTMLEEESTISLKIHKQQKSHDDFYFYDFSFRSEPMNYEEERVLIITEYYYDQYELLPRKIYLTEDQYVVFQNSQVLVSYYNTLSQRSYFKLPDKNNKILYYTKDNAVIDGDKIIYINNELVEPFSVKPIKLHYECNYSLVIFNSVEKIFEVSHWGNIAVEEKYQIENIGAKLIGEFGRVDYDDEGIKGGKNALRTLYSKLPLRANNLWYRDEIGNVSSSKAFRDWEDVKLDLELRFPLLGGWKSNYNIGYSLPTKFHVSVDNDGLNRLNLSFGLGYDDMLAKNFTYRIILPEHADIQKIILPIEASYSVDYEKSYSFLDFFGRTTAIITINNLFDVHRVPIEVIYYHNSAWLLFKPALLVLFFLLIFVIIIIINRVDISLKVSDSYSIQEQKSKYSSSLEDEFNDIIEKKKR